MNNAPHTKKINVPLIILGSTAIIFVVFALGVYVGYRKAVFVSGRGNRYDQYFSGGPIPGSAPGFMSGMPGSTHGIVGVVVDVSSSSILVRSPDNDEESVSILQDTVVRMMAQTVGAGSIAVGDAVAAIGQPTADGQIAARFIRILEASSSTPAVTSTL